MHIDYLNITVPETVAATVHDGVMEILDFCGAIQITDEVHRLGERGSVKIKQRHGYALVGLSGNAIEVLSSKHQFESLLWVFAAQPHRVTSMDIAHDVAVPSRPVLNSLWRRARGAKGIRLSKKRVLPKNVNRHMVHCLYDDGSTGTIYLGRRTSEVHCKVYDKRNEIYDRTGSDIGNDLVRYELTVTSKMGISLKDVQQPESLFWNFMSEVLPPPNVAPSPWVAGGQGFVMPERFKVMPAEKLKTIVSGSPELDRWLKYADEVGPNGREFLVGLLTRRILSTSTTDKPAQVATKHEGDPSDR